MSDGAVDPECAEVRSALSGRRWQSLSDAEVGKLKDALPLLTGAAFCHYLPAYLVVCLRARATADTAWHSVIFALTPPKRRSGTGWETFARRVAGLTAEQAKAILAYLEHVDEIEADGAGVGLAKKVRVALDYWSQPER